MKDIFIPFRKINIEELFEFWDKNPELRNLGRELRQELNSRLHKGEITFDWNGHVKSRVTKPVVPEEYEYPYRRDFGYEETITNNLRYNDYLNYDNIKEFEKALQDKTTVRLNDIAPFLHCYECGCNLDFLLRGNKIRVKTACKYPEGYPPFSVEIDIPSGVMVFANYFRCKAAGERTSSMPSNKKDLEFYAKQASVIQAFCGNTCPVVYQDGNSLYVGKCGLDNDYEVIDPFPGVDVGSICTDLWAWSMADFKTAKKLKEKGDFIVNVTPGRYKVTQYYYHNRNDDNNEKELYATIKPI